MPLNGDIAQQMPNVLNQYMLNAMSQLPAAHPRGNSAVTTGSNQSKKNLKAKKKESDVIQNIQNPLAGFMLPQ
jgi:hypothetical protein